MIRKCFTINQNRTTEEFQSYHTLFEKGLFQAIEIFYPYDKTIEEMKTYEQNVHDLMKYPIEVVLHLPHGPNSDLCDDQEETIERFKKAIDFSKQFSVKKLTLHLGYVTKNGVTKDREKLFLKSVQTVKTLAKYAYPANIMIENMPDIHEMGYSPNEIKRLIDEVQLPNVKFILDFGHANVSEYPIESYIDLLKDHLYHMHIHDNDGTRDQHKPLGQGNISFKTLFKKLTNYHELYCLEILYQTVEDLIQYENDLNQYV